MKTSRRLVANALAAGLGLSLWGCSTSTPGTAPQLDTNNIIVPAVGFVNPKFDPTVGDPSQIPLPIDILRSSAPDANLGLNLGIPDDGTDATRSIRTIRGFSTTGNIIIPFDGQVQGSSVTPQSILMFEGAESATQNDFTNTTIACNITVINPEENGAGGTSTVILQPQLPLRPGRDHFVVVTNQVLAQNRNIGSPRFAQLTKGTDPLVDGNGISQLFPLSNAQAQQLEPLRAAFQDWWQRAEDATGRQRSEIPLVFRFGTQNLFPAMAQLSGQARTDARGFSTVVQQATNQATVENFFRANLPDSEEDTFIDGTGAAGSKAGITNIGQIYTGRINPRNYITTSQASIQPLSGLGSFFLAVNPLGTPPNAPTEGFFQGTGVPPTQSGPIPADPVIAQSDILVPFICCLPSTAKPPGGYPTVIYQHGLGRNKKDVLRVADVLCSRGFAVIGIDLWYHGDLAILLSPPPNLATLPTEPNANPNLETGRGFINPGNLRGTRDNIRQSATNLLYLSFAIASGQGELDAGSAGPELAPLPTGNFPRFLGHSLGGIVGGVYSAVDAVHRRGVLSVSGGRLTELLLASNNRGQALRDQLFAASNGVLVPGSAAFDQFILIAQTVLDDADPINYAAPGLVGRFRAVNPTPAEFSNVLLQQVVPDNTIPNSATQDLARAFNQVPGFRLVGTTFTTNPVIDFLTQAAFGFNGSGLTQVDFGNHEVLISGTGNTISDARRVQAQAADYLATGAVNAP